MSLNSGKFTQINESFQCDHCRKEVPPTDSSCRNHCPFCLHSKHVDINPGDRANPCKGLMRPIGYELSGKKGLVLTFKCTKCAQVTKNMAALESKTAPDDYDLILTLS